MISREVVLRCRKVRDVDTSFDKIKATNPPSVNWNKEQSVGAKYFNAIGAKHRQ